MKKKIHHDQSYLTNNLIFNSIAWLKTWNKKLMCDALFFWKVYSQNDKGNTSTKEFKKFRDVLLANVEKAKNIRVERHLE